VAAGQRKEEINEFASFFGRRGREGFTLKSCTIFNYVVDVGVYKLFEGK